MNKNKLFTLFNQLHVLFAIGSLITVGIYVTAFPKEMFGLIDKQLFSIDFTTAMNEVTTVFNSALIAVLFVLLFNIFLIVYVFVIKKTTDQAKKEQTIINMMLSGLMVIGQLAFYVFVPEQINGKITHNPLFTRYDVLSDSQVYGWNFVVVLGVLYLAYNIYNLAQTSKKSNKNTKK